MHLFLVGAGHVGLVTAVGMARHGHRVTVADIDAQRIQQLREGRPPMFEPGLEEALGELAGSLTFTTDLAPPADARHSFVIVGTPESEDGPLSMHHVLDAVGALLDRVAADHVIVVRSTLPLSGPAALAALRRERRPGDEAPAIVTNPEFLREGSALRDFESPGRIIAGWIEERDRAAAEDVIGLYRGVDAPTMVADARSVALIKLASNVFLAMKIAYANELARLADAIGADAPLVSDGIGLDERIGRMFLDAGPGYGGSCLPEQAMALPRMTAAAGVPTPLIDAIWTSNQTHQSSIVGRLGSLLGGDVIGKRIALLGLAFKANTDDVRQSPALALAAELREAGATVVATDPRAEAKARRADPELTVAASPVEAARDADAVLIATEWPEYRTLDWSAMAEAMHGNVVYDTRNVADPASVAAAELTLHRLGRP